ncbi:MAG: capsular polysaccharide biosynthesis protein [Oscillospiraceae bacterium]|nr:capsular polysaccharide biosynthesis protein [Oscillospiraceae bacterium]
MLDFHTHILPGMDDGSKDVSTSLAMLEASAAYGADAVAVTPHFYGEDNSPAQFLARRDMAFRRLTSVLEASGGDYPRLLLGAEVRFFNGISITEDLDSLCLEGTRLLLLEMPFVRWNERMLREVAAISRRGVKPVAAHVERYMDFQPKRILADFMGLDIYIQCNAEFFLTRKTARRALHMLENGQIQFLGSDAHNTTTRPPNLFPARELIRQKMGQDALDYLAEYESLALEESGAWA